MCLKTKNNTAKEPTYLHGFKAALLACEDYIVLKNENGGVSFKCLPVYTRRVDKSHQSHQCSLNLTKKNLFAIFSISKVLGDLFFCST